MPLAISGDGQLTGGLDVTRRSCLTTSRLLRCTGAGMTLAVADGSLERSWGGWHSRAEEGLRVREASGRWWRARVKVRRERAAGIAGI